MIRVQSSVDDSLMPSLEIIKRGSCPQVSNKSLRLKTINLPISPTITKTEALTCFIYFFDTMKLYFIIAACFALAGSATVTGRDTEEVSALSEAAVAANRCGASESCRGAGDSNLCDDRVCFHGATRTL